MDRLITSVPGMEKFLRCRDLPSFCRATDINDPTLRGIISETLKTPQAYGFILNTFEDLEGPILSHIRTKCPNIYSIGPLHQHLKSRILKSNSSSVNSLFEVDRSCITWLDKQPPKSVVYVSFGSLTIMKREKLMEFWYGLVNSKKRFLWVVRPDLVIDGEDKIPEELEEGTIEKGYIGWMGSTRRGVVSFCSWWVFNGSLPGIPLCQGVIPGIPPFPFNFQIYTSRRTVIREVHVGAVPSYA